MKKTYILPVTYESWYKVKSRLDKLDQDHDVNHYKDFENSSTRFSYIEFEDNNKEVKDFMNNNNIAVIHHKNTKNIKKNSVNNEFRFLKNGLIKYKATKEAREWRKENKPNYVEKVVNPLFRKYYTYRNILNITGILTQKNSFDIESNVSYPIQFQLHENKELSEKELRDVSSKFDFSIAMANDNTNIYDLISKKTYSKQKLRYFSGSNYSNYIRYYPLEDTSISDHFRILYMIEEIYGDVEWKTV